MTRRPDHAERLEYADSFRRARAAAERYPCDQPPLGCGMPAGETCRVIGRPDLVLHHQPAHLCRLKAAGVAPASTVGTMARRDGDRPDGAPIPDRNRHLYDQPDPYQGATPP